MESVHGKANIQAIICIIIEPRKKKKVPKQGSNRGPLDLQSNALPTELGHWLSVNIAQ